MRRIKNLKTKIVEFEQWEDELTWRILYQGTEEDCNNFYNSLTNGN